MDLKIGSIQAASLGRYSEIQKKAAKPAAIGQESDKVELSGSKVLFAQALAAAQGASEVRGERVDAIRSAVQSGSYQINSRLIAERILSGIR